MAIVLSNMDVKINPQTMALKAIECGARVSGGTSLKILSDTISKQYGIKYKVTNDSLDAILAIKDGSLVIANVGGDREGHTGIFSSGGHYIVLVDVIGDSVVVVDPGLYTGKYWNTYRSKYVNVVGNLLYANMESISADCSNRNPKYYIYSK